MARPERPATVQAVAFFASFLLVALVALAASLATGRSVETWYPGLDKPPLTPPAWVFGPVWTVLYALMAVAAWLVWRSDTWDQTAQALGMYAVQLVLNGSWSLVFFTAQRPGIAILVILALLGALAVTILLFYRRHRTAAYLLLPYFLWVAFASYLNIGIWALNA